MSDDLPLSEKDREEHAEMIHRKTQIGAQAFYSLFIQALVEILIIGAILVGFGSAVWRAL